jgi:foldase protein PrsA
MFEELSNDEATEHLLFDNQYIRYKTRHILLETKEEFEEVFALLNDEENPADFSDLARLYSIHSTSAVKGGDLGYKTVGEMPFAYEQMALTIEPYTVSEIFETELGFHVIFVDDRQMLQDMIESGMPEDQLDSYKADIIKNYAASEMVRVFNEMRDAALPIVNEELLIEE